MIAGWPCPPSGAREYALAIDHDRPRRLLVVPALFDEANRLRRFTVEALRALDAAGVDALLPDLPGTNESLASLAAQSLETWREAMAAAALHFGATHVLALRGGALVAPNLPGWALAPVGGAAVLRQMLRVRLLSAREAGQTESREELLETARHEGIELAGYPLGAAMIAGLEQAEASPALAPIAQADLGGGALWLRAEPDEDAAQSARLAQIVAAGLQG
ncbi:hypothetical protein ACFOD9_10385 [Novosphingobium bradum]|uniref:Uncharacterized protein n=1 Tax=Novosphingobium bradum TaxID=1737444 RepID=A0ABV7IPQ4_9SPHN